MSNWTVHRWLAPISLASSMLLAVNQQVSAKELTEGFIIDAANFESVKGDTFEGRLIESMFSDAYQMLIKDEDEGPVGAL